MAVRLPVEINDVSIFPLLSPSNLHTLIAESYGFAGGWATQYGECWMTRTVASLLIFLTIALGGRAAGGGNVGAHDGVSPASAPTVSVSLSNSTGRVGESVTLTWSSTNATSCNASGSWAGPEPLSGSQMVTPSAPGSYTYSLSCAGSDGSANGSVTLGVPSPPTVGISANLSNVFVGQRVTLTWSSTNASSCTASGSWSGSESTSGRQTRTPNAAGFLLYALSCTGTGGSAGTSITVVANTPSLSLENTFSPNAVTISTSEGAPYDDCDFWITTAAECIAESNLGHGPTKVMRLYICLSGEVAVFEPPSHPACSQQPKVTGPLSQTILSDMNTRIAAYAGTGVRVMPRFIYNFGPTAGRSAKDAPINVIAENVGQIAPVVLQNKDLIFALEAGFIGTWGEWHDSTNGNDTAKAQAIVLKEELSYFSGLFPILVRSPGDLIEYTGTLTPQAGLGIHDDYYASASDDGGTFDSCERNEGHCLSSYTASQLASYTAAVSKSTMFVGEFGALYPNLQTCSALDAYSYMFHPQSIAIEPFPATVGRNLQKEGCATSFYNKVGTRIEVQRATIIGNPIPNGQLYISLTMANTGYGRVIRPRPATLVFVSSGKIVGQIPMALSTMDLRELASSSPPTPHTFEVNVALPASFPTSGSVSLAVLIPDPAPSLKAQPAYVLPLNSLDQNGNPIFDPATGYNTIATFNAK